MPRRPAVRLSPRRTPRQRRSRFLVDAILEAASRVLAEDEARFTSARVAERAGISVGSLYQYFPSKEAILFRLQADEWTATWAACRQRLFAPGAPSDRLREAVRFFFQTEAAEARLRSRLSAAGPLLDDTPEARALAQKAERDVARFLAECAPHLSARQRRFWSQLGMAALGGIAEECTDSPRNSKELRRWADATTHLLLAALDRPTNR